MRKIVAVVVLMGILIAPVAFAAELFGIVADKNGKPVQTKVILKDASAKSVGDPVATDKNGSYAFKDIKPGTYTVEIGEKNTWKIFVGPGETRRDLTVK